MRAENGRASGTTTATGPEGARVLVVGLGGLGCPAASVLAEAGVGTLVLVDPDVVERSNLNRQLLHQVGDLGRPKVLSAAEKLGRRFPGVRVETFQEALADDNAAHLLSGIDFALDCTDGAATKYRINDAAVRLGRPYAHAGVLGFSGQALTVLPGRSACLRCVFPHQPAAGEIPSCLEAGIIGPVAHVIGALQAAEALRYLRGETPRLAGFLWTFDGWRRRWQQIRVSRAPDCRCGLDSSLANVLHREMGAHV